MTDLTATERIRHPNVDFTHSTSLVCQHCPSWPHTYCVSSDRLRAALTAAEPDRAAETEAREA